MAENFPKKYKNGEDITGKIVSVLEYFSLHERTILNWLGDNNKDYKQEIYFLDMLFSQGFLSLPGVKYQSLSKGKNKHTSLHNDTRVIYLTKEGYAFLNAYRFNKQSLVLNQKTVSISNNVKLISFLSLIVAIIALIISFIAFLTRV